MNEKDPEGKAARAAGVPIRGGARPGAGRPKLGKVQLSCWVLPETRAKLGDKPGATLDALLK